MKTERVFRAIKEKYKDGPERDATEMVIRIHCGVCPATLDYSGNEKQAADAVRRHGWTLSAAGTVRCSDCSSVRHRQLRWAIR
jgi:hypothetical protein